MMHSLSKLKDSLVSEPIGVITLVLTVALYWHQSYQNHTSEKRAEVVQRAAEVRLQGIDFQTYMGAYVAAILDGRPLDEPRTKLTENVMRQYAAVDLSKDVYSDETKELAKQYRDELTMFQSTLPNVKTVTEMRPFWEAASDVLTVRDKFLLALGEQS